MNETTQHFHIESTLPKPWETDESFNDVLYDWMTRAPWFLISGALHIVAAFVLAAIPWSSHEEPDDKGVTVGLDAPADEIEDEIVPPEVDIETTEVEVDIEQVEISDVAETDNDEPFDSTEGNEGLNDSPLESSRNNSALGVGGGAGGKYGLRSGSNKNAGPGGKKQPIIRAGLEWLAAHQDEDGKWDCDEFMKHDPDGDLTAGAGDASHDVGVTALALLAFLGDGHSLRRGDYKDVVMNGISWLVDQQNAETGLIGDKVSHSYLYDHAIATLALCEVASIDGSNSVKRKARAAVEFITYARNPYRVWRYTAPGDGENDTSVTGWMIFALKSAQDAGINVDKEAFAASIEWFDEMTDEATGRVGYRERGSASSRVPGLNSEYDTEGGEAMTAVALLCRFFLGQDPESTEVMHKHADLLLRSLPKWSDDGSTNDMYYWYYGSYAMYQMDGKYWDKWEKAMKPAIVDTQRGDGASKGSWDPNGPWGYSGGRVYSTATMVLCLESYYRYGRVLGGR